MKDLASPGAKEKTRSRKRKDSSWPEHPSDPRQSKRFPEVREMVQRVPRHYRVGRLAPVFVGEEARPYCLDSSSRIFATMASDTSTATTR